MSEARTSQILADLASRPDERLRVGDLLKILKDRAFALLIVLLALPNCLPMPPPIPLVCGLLLAFVAVQFVLGRETPWLPRRLLDRSVARADLGRALSRAIPALQWLERFSKPRLTLFETALALRLIGILLLLLAIGIVFALPPLVGQIPLSIAVCLVGLGIVERDGLVVLCGFVLGVAGLVLSVSFVYAMISAVGLVLK